MTILSSKLVRRRFLAQLLQIENRVIQSQLTIDDARKGPTPTIDKALVVAEVGWRLNQIRQHLAHIASAIGGL